LLFLLEITILKNPAKPQYFYKIILFQFETVLQKNVGTAAFLVGKWENF
jgi:hypothetical protein